MKRKDEEQDETLYELASLIAIYSNPQMFPFDIGKLSEEERLKIA